MKRLVAPFGFYGAGNIGDEATLIGFARLLSHYDVRLDVSVGSRNPTHTARVVPTFDYFNSSSRDPRRWWAKLLASAYAVVGGTPIMDVEGDWPLSELAPLVRAIDRQSRPLAFIGSGTETLRQDKSRRIVAEEIVPRVRHWSVRCQRDRERLIAYGVPPEQVTVAADMAWLIAPSTPEFGHGYLQQLGLDPRQPLIGVNITNENHMLDQHPAMVEALASALDELADRLDARVIFLANEVRADATFDTAAARLVIARMWHTDRVTLAPNQYLAPPQMMSIIASCALTLSMRYHFCLFSALQGVPFIAIERSNKIADLCWDIDWAARVMPPAFTAIEIVAHATRLHENARAVPGHLHATVRTMRERALRNVVALNALSQDEPIAVNGRSLVVT